MGRRTWIKIFTDKWLRGSIRQEPLEIRAIWVDILALAGDSAYGHEGIIQVSEGMGFTDEQLAHMLNIPLSLWQEAKKKLASGPDPRIEILPNNVIKVTKWKQYQSEYQRQKPYRKSYTQKLHQKVTPESYTEKLQGDIEEEGEEDIEGEGEDKNIISVAAANRSGGLLERLIQEFDLDIPEWDRRRIRANFRTFFRKHPDVADDEVVEWVRHELKRTSLDPTSLLLMIGRKFMDWRNRRRHKPREYLSCDCGFATVKGKFSQSMTTCPSCGSPLRTEVVK